MEPLTVAKLIAILQRMDRDAPVIVEGEKDAPAAVGVSRTYGADRMVISGVGADPMATSCRS